MNHEATYQGQRNLGMVAGSGMANTPQPIRTLAARLESAASTILSQCNRIEDTLAKINGTPRTSAVPIMGQEKSASTAPLSQSVEQAEMLSKRLCDLASNLEQVA